MLANSKQLLKKSKVLLIHRKRNNGTLNVTIMQPVKLFLLLEHHAALAVRHQVNPLRANPTKWSNTLKHFADCCQRIV